ncbi:histidine decarboxylase [Vibrio pectenicida]|uniref:histidine decarboxylase n=1 Tax=Vibrio pectenicida TaxID=62763 RepID=UPI003B9986D5
MPLSYVDTQRLRDLYKVCTESQHQMLGYPVATDYDYRDLWSFFQFSINNIGDWAEPSNYPMDTFEFEQDVVEYFCKLYHTTLDEAWGYVTNGGTEGNMYGCYLAREKFPSGIVYFSDDTHYSVMKIVRFLNIEYQMVASNDMGEMDYDDLEFSLRANIGKSPVIFANIGTTMLGAIDDLKQIQQRLQKVGIPREQYYIHADAACHGMIVPYLDNPPRFSFKHGIDSISVSGHKMLGSPIPCGMVLALTKHTDKVSHQIEYIAAWRHANSPIVVFPKPSEELWRKYHLAVANNIAHIIIAGQTTVDPTQLYQVLDELIAENQSEMQEEGIDERVIDNELAV